MNATSKTYHSKDEYMKIGKNIYENKMTVMDAAVIYDVNYYTARNWLRMYKAYLRNIEYDIAQ